MNEETQYPTVHKVIGAPGTGKTTNVVGNPELEIDGLFINNLEEYSFDDQMIVTYTNAGVDEAADRLYKMTDQPKYKIEDRITTIHSQCFSILDLDREQVVGHWEKKKFCQLWDLDYGWDDDEDDIMGADLDEGNALFRIYGWLKSNLKPIEEWKDCPIDWDHEGDPERLLNEWEDFKEKNDWVDFSDMIHKVLELGYKQLENLGWGVLFPDEDTGFMEMFKKARDDPQRDPELIRGKGAFIDTKVLYVDEVQDLSPDQWAWYLLQKLVCEEVYIGGDDDQTIYGWAGANPEFMLNEEGTFEVLDKTYRIPEQVWDVCDGVIRQVDERQEKDVTPEGDDGEFVTMRAPSTRQTINHLEEGECMVLFRANYMIDEFRDDLHERGIPYRNMSTYDTWSDDIVKLRDALAKIERGEKSIKGDELDIMMEYAEDHMLKSNSGMSESEKVMGQLGGISSTRVGEVFDITPGYGRDTFNAKDYLQKTEEVNWYEQQAILGNIKAGNTHMEPDRVRIGTIHSAKGKEAETVLLATDSTQTILKEMSAEISKDGAGTVGSRSNDPTPVTDAERRVYYVGMTRASKKLVMAQGVINPDTAIDLNSLLPDDHSPDDWESQQSEFTAPWE